jgi:LmbE family N-acetylglucosaminyl deacetylase
MVENGVPESAMVIVAHPDDAEFTMAGTVAAWTKGGCRVTSEIRRAEQQAACETLGVADVVFLGYDDGLLQPTLDLRRDLVRVIRQYKPQVVLTSDPTRFFSGDRYINHPDHRAAGQAALDAVAPAAQMPLLWPEIGEPHKVHRVYVYGNGEPNEWVDIGETLTTKLAALKQHASQMGDWDPTERITAWAAEVGKTKGMAYAESFRVITLVQPDTEE